MRHNNNGHNNNGRIVIIIILILLLLPLIIIIIPRPPRAPRPSARPPALPRPISVRSRSDLGDLGQLAARPPALTAAASCASMGGADFQRSMIDLTGMSVAEISELHAPR